MARQKILDAIRSILKREDTPLPVHVIFEKVKAEFNIADLTDTLIAESLSSSIEKNQKDKRPDIVKLGDAYGLGSWFSEWPPKISDLAHKILLGNNRRPLHLAELAECVQSVRIINEPAVVAVRLAVLNDERFLGLGSGMYGLHGWKKYLENTNDFFYSTPAKNWIVSQKLVELVEDADENLKIACPYIDRSTFEMFLEHAPSQVRISLIVCEDPYLPRKVSEGLTQAFVLGWLQNRRIAVKRVDDLHSRFLIVDDSFAIVTSADLQKNQQQQKFQYLLLSADPVVTSNCLAYFDQLWRMAATIDLAAEIAKVEQGSTKSKLGTVA